MGHASNTQIIRASKLLNRIGSLSNKYNTVEVYNNSEESDSDYDNFIILNQNYKSPIIFEILEGSTLTTTESNLNSLCELYISSKHTRTVIHKSMTEVKKNLDKAHVDLWGSHTSPSPSRKIYAAILLDIKICKS